MLPVQLKPKFDLQASLSKGMPNTKVGPKVAIPPAKSGAAAAAPDASPAKPVKSPVKQAAITRVTAGLPIRCPHETLKLCQVFTLLAQENARASLLLLQERQQKRGRRRTGGKPFAHIPPKLKPLTSQQAQEQRGAAQRPRVSHHVKPLVLKTLQGDMEMSRRQLPQ